MGDRCDSCGKNVEPGHRWETYCLATSNTHPSTVRIWVFIGYCHDCDQYSIVDDKIGP